MQMMIDCNHEEGKSLKELICNIQERELISLLLEWKQDYTFESYIDSDTYDSK